MKEQLEGIRAILPDRAHILSESRVKVVVSIPKDPNEGLYCICQRIERNGEEINEMLMITHNRGDGTGRGMMIENGEIIFGDPKGLEELTREILTFPDSYFQVLLPAPEGSRRRNSSTFGIYDDPGR